MENDRKDTTNQASSERGPQAHKNGDDGNEERTHKEPSEEHLRDLKTRRFFFRWGLVPTVVGFLLVLVITNLIQAA